MAPEAINDTLPPIDTALATTIRDMSGEGCTPIILGVTGHCTLGEDVFRAVHDEVLLQFSKLQREYPSSGFILVSSLAPGSDCVVAQAALECGFRLVAPLPLPIGDIRSDHEATGTLDIFETLVSAAGRGCYSLYPPSSDPSELADPKIRAEYYKKATVFLASQAEILFAIWDGVWDRDSSVTALGVDIKLKGMPTDLIVDRDLLDHIDSGLVFHVSVAAPAEGARATASTVCYAPLPRYLTDLDGGRRPAAAGSLPEFITLAGQDLIPPTYKKVFANIDAFNRDVREFNASPGSAAKLLESRSYLLGDVLAAKLTPVQNEIAASFCVSDCLATKYKSASHHWFGVMAALVMVSSISFILFAHVPVGPQVMPLLLTSFALLLIAKKRRDWLRHRGRFQDRFQDYRALAEGLRVQMYWSLAGISESVAVHYMTQQKTELDWIRAAIRPFHVIQPPHDQQGDEHLEYVAEHWIGGQLKYFHAGYERNHALHKATDNKFHGALTLATALMGLSMVLLTVLGVVYLSDEAAQKALEYHPYRIAKDIAVIAIDLLFLYGGYVRYRAETFAVEHDVKQYLKMHIVYSRAAQRFVEFWGTRNHASIKRLFKDLGKMALAENGDWLLLHRERRLEMELKP